MQLFQKIEGNADYAKKYWDILTTWTNYLVEYGQDPGKTNFARMTSPDIGLIMPIFQ
ncbi:glutaminase domain-containing protein [Bacteroides ovatus]|uniref:glutaminase domain-containing protein n=1 Tax=Bacteroides ovatus TaxID=28116 RepID=UPI000DE5804B